MTNRPIEEIMAECEQLMNAEIFNVYDWAVVSRQGWPATIAYARRLEARVKELEADLVTCEKLLDD